jgi:Fe-S-cluster containining protein
LKAVRLISTEEKKTAGSFIFGMTRDAGITNFVFSRFDTEDWILTPELREAVNQFESNFNIAGNPYRNHLRLTHNLKTFLKELQIKYPPATIAKTGASIFQCFNVFFTNLSSFPMGRARAIAAYELLDRELKISANMATTCRQGCNACCHLDKEITYDEADLLAFLIKNEVRCDMRLLEKQIAQHGRNRKNGHRSKSAARCPLLGKNQLCKVYEYRPMVCRKYSVTSSPDECYKKHGMIRQIPLIAEEVVVSAALSCRGNYYDSMPIMLGKALEAEDCKNQIEKEINVIRIRSDSTEGSSEFQRLRYPDIEPAANDSSFFFNKGI